MRATTISLGLVSLLFTGAFNLSLAQPTLPVPAQPVPWHPCAKITAACTQAGFFPTAPRWVLGSRWIVSRRKQAAKALPQIDPQLVLACKQRNPNFGMDGAPIVAFSLRAP